MIFNSLRKNIFVISCILILVICNDSFGQPKIEMIFVEGGTFVMGTNTGISEEKPVHNVTLSSFYMGKYEVTQAQWKAIMGSNPSAFKDCDNCPVERVNWDDVQDFIIKLNGQTKKNYRLPTEAEWEYAARGGKLSKGYLYSGSDNLKKVAWFSQTADETHEVGTKKPNELGLFDMTGNVYEWCSDRYGAYSSDSQTNPTGSYGRLRVKRGGSWGYESSDEYFWTTYRGAEIPTTRDVNLGFRLCLSTE